MSATPDRIEKSLALVHAIAAGIDAAYKRHDCTGIGDDRVDGCGLCLLKATVDEKYREFLADRTHQVDAEALAVPVQTEIAGVDGPDVPPAVRPSSGYSDMNSTASEWLARFQGTEVDGMVVDSVCGGDELFLWWNATTGMTRTLRWPDVRAMLDGRD